MKYRATKRGLYFLAQFMGQCWSPLRGLLHHIKSSCKLKYKLAIKDAYTSYENSLDDELLKFYTNKQMPEFWKVWNAKFKRSISNQIHVIGCKVMSI